jgi:flagellar basal-body rod protein FlgF
MDRLMYSSLSAMRSSLARQSAVANNLANANTPGFRSELSAAQPLWLDGGAGQPTRAFASEEVLSADMKGGAVSHSGRELDVALDGDAMLTVQADDGTEAYTRRGDLQVSDSGLLTTGDGKPVLGDSGPITIPPYDKLSIDSTGAVNIIPVGGELNNPQTVDHIKLVSPKGSQAVKGLDGLFHVQGGGTLPADPDARVASGSIEGSNVNVTQSLVDMIEASRSWETQVKMLSTSKQMDTDTANLMQLPDS